LAEFYDGSIFVNIAQQNVLSMIFQLKNYKLSLFLGVITIFFSFYSCDESSSEICYSNQQSVQTGFYSSYHKNDIDTTLNNVTLVGIMDSERIDTMIAKDESIKKSFLPLSMFHDTTHYVIQVNNFTDTISFVHSKELSFVSEECGFIFEFEIDTVLYSKTSFIDSVAISYPSVIYNESKENVKIYIY